MNAIETHGLTKDYGSIVAVKEFSDNVRSKRFVLIGIFYLAIALMCTAITTYLYSLTKNDLLPGMFTPAGVFSFMGIFNSILALLSLVVAADSISIEKNTLISIIGAIMAWAGLMFLNMVGGIIGMVSMSDQPGSQYPLYVNVLKWLDPMSHNVMDMILAGQAQDASGLPLWANVLILVAYAGILLLVSIEIFKRQDL